MHSFDSNTNIPTFILKLWKLVEDEQSNNLVCWNRDGRSFIICDQARFAKELLPMYFKHSNMASFIRQLNMYGFRKVSNIENGGLKSEGDEVEFFHHCFSRGQQDQLQFIKRKLSSNNKSLTSIVKVDEVQDLLSDVESMKERQESVDSSLNTMKRENEALWREVAILRQKHLKQQQIVEKLLNFLVSIVRNRVVGGIKRKAPLMIDSTSGNNRKVMKPNKEPACLPSPSPGTSGPIIHDITDLDDNCDLAPLMNDPSNQLINALPLNLDNPDNNFQLIEDCSGSLNGQNISKLSLPSHGKHLLIPDNMLDFSLTEDSDNIISNDISFEDKINSVLSTPQIVYDETPTTSSKKPMKIKTNDNETVNAPSVNTDLILSKQNSSITPAINRLTAEYLTFTGHLDGIDEELNWLQDQLYEGGLYIDPSQLLEIFPNEQFPVQLEQNTPAVQSKAIMDGSMDSNLRLIKVEDNSNDGLFEDLDLNNITHDTKDILSEVDFTSDLDPSQFH